MRKNFAALLAATSLTLPGHSLAAETAGGDAAPRLVPLPTMSLPIIDADRVDGTLHLDLMVEASDAGAANRIAAHLPRIRSTSVAAALEFARLNASRHRTVDAERLSRALTEALHATEPGVSKVLVTRVSARAR